MAEAVLLSPLPYEQPEELVIVPTDMEARDFQGFPTSARTLLEYERQATLFDGFAGLFTFQQALTGEGEPVQVQTGFATWDLFDVLGVEPLIGRTFLPRDGEPLPPDLPTPAGGFPPPLALVLTHGFWQQHFGGDRSVLGRTVELNGQSVEIVGVLPPEFELHMPAWAGISDDVDLWTATRIDPEAASFINVTYHVIGRLNDGVTVEQASAEMDQISEHIRGLDATLASAGFRARVEPYQRDLTAEVRPAILALMGAVVFVLLIACANVSNLLLVRATTRQKELAVRAAMGGSRGRLIRQMFVESGVLAALGAVLGVGIAYLAIELLLVLQPEDLPRIGEVGLNGTVLGFTALAAAAAAVIFGAIPALQGTRVDLATSLRDRAGEGLTRVQRMLRNGVVVAEVALSVVLLVGAGLMVRSFAELQRVEPGYDPEHLLTFDIQLPAARYPDPADAYNFFTQLERRLEALAGARSASGAIPFPLADLALQGRYGTERALEDDSYFRQADYRIVHPGYFETMGTRLIAGRTFTAADEADSAAYVVVDRKLAEATWPGESAVGRPLWIRLTSNEPERMEVIGVVEHQRAQTLAEDGRETVYIPRRYAGFPGMTWAVRTTGDPVALAPQVRALVREMDPLLPVAQLRTMESYVTEDMAQTRFSLILIGVFGLGALALAAVGLYGVLAYLVRRRTREIGIRMAFGAPTGKIRWLVVGRGMGLAAVGIVAGLGGALVLTQLMESMLVNVTPTDPLTFASIAGVFAAVAALACWVPAWRATRVDPVGALSAE